MVNVDITGLNDAFEAIMGLVIPWRRQNAERRAKLENARRQAEIHHLNAETLIARAKAEREQAAAELDKKQAELIRAQARKTEAEANLILARAQQAMAEAEKERAQLRQGQIELALTIVNQHAPDLSELEKLDYVFSRLLSVLDKLISSDLEPKLITNGTADET